MNMWKEGMGIDIENKNEGQDSGENGSVVEHVGTGIREPGEGLEDEKKNSVV
jgi:hypothetical protein